MRFSRLLVVLGLMSAPAFAISFFTTTAGLNPNDQFVWSQLGLDGASIANNFPATSTNSKTLTGSFGTASNDGLVSVVCPASPSCSWTTSGTGINAAESLIWAFDPSVGHNNGTAPLTFTFGSSLFGAGAWIQADSSTAYTVKLEAFNGITSLGSNTTTSDGSGDPVFYSVVDTTADITKVVFSLTSCPGCNGGAGDLGDFAVDTLQIKEATAVPEPGTLLLLGIGLTVGATRLRRSEQTTKKEAL